MKKALLPVITFARIDLKRLFRDKAAIFWVFAFPLVFLLIFGSIFKGTDSISFRVALINESKTEFAKEFDKQVRDSDVFEVDTEATSLSAAKEKMNRSQLEAAIVLPASFGAVGDKGYPTGQASILYDQSNESAGSALKSIMNEGIFKEVNNKLVPYEAPFSAEAQSTATKGLSRFDYTFAGILGFTLLSLGIFGPTSVFPRLKSRGVLRRYKTTTLKVWQYFVGNVISTGLIGLLATALMFLTAVLVFDLNMRGNYLTLGLVALLGTLMLFGIGLAIGGWARNENQAAPLAQIAALPMMFLSGVFFPTFLMPETLQAITQYIPLTPVVEAVRLVITENASLVDLGPQLGIMTAWTVAVYALAFKVFRWE